MANEEGETPQVQPGGVAAGPSSLYYRAARQMLSEVLLVGISHLELPLRLAKIPKAECAEVGELVYRTVVPANLREQIEAERAELSRFRRQPYVGLSKRAKVLPQK